MFFYWQLASTAFFSEQLHSLALPVWWISCFCVTQSCLLLAELSALWELRAPVRWSRQEHCRCGCSTGSTSPSVPPLGPILWRIFMCWNVVRTDTASCPRSSLSLLSGDLRFDILHEWKVGTTLLSSHDVVRATEHCNSIHLLVIYRERCCWAWRLVMCSVVCLYFTTGVIPQGLTRATKLRESCYTSV